MGQVSFTAYVAIFFLSVSAFVLAHDQCRCFPGDSCWPSIQTWSAFNNSIGGRLIATVPLGSPCHDPAFDSDVCKTLQNEWLDPQIHYTSSSSIMAPFFANQSCDPFQPQSRPCVIGTYIQYAVNVSTPAHVSKTLKFATEHNIRVVIRNTGHDYNGKSTGAGSIGIWTHHLKSIHVTDYKSEYYTGKAIKVGAGVQLFDVNTVAHNQNLVVVGGQCSSVGLAGGYTQGGGHSTLSTRFGLAADQALEWEVIDGQGNFIKASRSINPDLYWALSGGGGGTYGIVWSLTVKAHPESYTTGASLIFSNANISQDTYFEVIKQYLATVPSIIDGGGMSIGTFTNTTFFLTFIGYGLHAPEAHALLAPISSNLTYHSIPYTTTLTEYPSWSDTIAAFSGPVQVGIDQYGSWLIPRSVVQSNPAALAGAYRAITETFNAAVVTFGLQAARPENVSNAVLPAWRDALIHTVLATPWSYTAPWADMEASQRVMTTQLVPKLSALAPESGAYLNEADPFQPAWQRAFYGVNYGRLRGIKGIYDPEDVFYARGAVGSDEWEEENEGRLCRI